MAEKEESDDHTVAEIEKKIIKAFDVFDHECNKAVDVRFMYEYYFLKYGIPVKNMEDCPGLIGQHQHCMSATGNIGSIVRSLGCFPAEAELHELLAKVEEDPLSGYIHLEKFLPVMTKVLLNRSYQPIPEDVLHAFEALDENKCEYITKADLVKYLTEEGEPFTQEEMENMLSTALDPDTITVHYRDYISKMIVDES